MLKPIIAAATPLAALTALGASAATATFDDSFVVILAEGAPDTAFVGGVNLPDGDRASIDQNTSDYGDAGSADGLITFLDFALPEGSAITSATLTFQTRSFSDGPVSVYQLTRAFDGTDTYNTFGAGLTVGTDTAATAEESISFLDDESPVSFDVTAAVAAWVEGGAPVYGFGIENASGDGWDFQVLSGPDGPAPFLEVEFAAPVPAPAALPLLLTALGALGFRRR